MKDRQVLLNSCWDCLYFFYRRGDECFSVNNFGVIGYPELKPEEPTIRCRPPVSWWAAELLTAVVSLVGSMKQTVLQTINLYFTRKLYHVVAIQWFGDDTTSANTLGTRGTLVLPAFGRPDLARELPLVPRVRPLIVSQEDIHHWLYVSQFQPQASPLGKAREF